MPELAHADVVVIGAGPAGLAASSTLAARGVCTLTVDLGSSLNDRAIAGRDGYVCGIGGAGLYSDGKFSFFPAASALWTLRPQNYLRDAYDWVRRLLVEHMIAAPDLPGDLAGASVMPAAGEATIKLYPSIYADPSARHSLVHRLVNEHPQTFQLQSRARIVNARAPEIAVGSNEGRHFGMLRPRAVIYAGGRFGPLRWPQLTAPVTFRRIEIGVRLEQEEQKFFFGREGAIDPKWIRRSDDGRCEWRTFCCCRQGEVVVTLFGDITSVSGRADCPSTGRSNVGFMVRFLELEDGAEALDRVTRGGLTTPVTVNAEEVMEGCSSFVGLFGESAAARIAEGLRALGREFAIDWAQVRIHAPAIEGVGYYPAILQSLRVGELPIWVAGDSCGAFRGIVAALVSGRMAALGVIDYMQSSNEQLLDAGSDGIDAVRERGRVFDRGPIAVRRLRENITEVR
jgi:hypothetical protein